MGKVRMVVLEFCGGEGTSMSTNTSRSKVKTGGPEETRRRRGGRVHAVAE